jgi:hypothetical protein
MWHPSLGLCLAEKEFISHRESLLAVINGQCAHLPIETIGYVADFHMRKLQYRLKQMEQEAEMLINDARHRAGLFHSERKHHETDSKTCSPAFIDSPQPYSAADAAAADRLD